jgi:S-adenosylmethionine:tRNA ribosyltransferase-isomerase
MSLAEGRLDLLAADFDYQLPPELIAQVAAEPRDAARLMVVDRATGQVQHRRFRELDALLAPGDLLVANRSRVLPARLRGRRLGSHGRCEVLLLRRLEPTVWEALVRPGRRLQPGARIELGPPEQPVEVEVGQQLPAGSCRLHLRAAADSGRLLALGEMPLPPYIRRWSGSPERYQTVFADALGSAAAPTAGLHFTAELLDRLAERGIDFQRVTLHVGLDTFRPLRAERVADHKMHAEWAEVAAETRRQIAATRARGGRIVAVGTTTVRALESAARHGSPGESWSGWTRLFITPGFRFAAIDAMITNFHLPRSTLLLLVGAFLGPELLQRTYRLAIQERYRFYSFGDAMLLV